MSFGRKLVVLRADQMDSSVRSSWVLNLQKGRPLYSRKEPYLGIILVIEVSTAHIVEDAKRDTGSVQCEQ
jgi:hypothetical protein